MGKKTGKQSHYSQEAASFVSVMEQLAPELQLDYSLKSVFDLESFISGQFDPPGSTYVGPTLPLGVGCYVGEVIIRNLGGRWDTTGKPQINQLGPIKETFPIQKALKRFEQGSQDSLAHYLSVIQSHLKK